MSRRRLRINHLLREELSELIRRQVKDPRLEHMVTITEVTVSADLRQARVFVSVLGTEEEKKAVLQGLESALGFLRHELASRLDLRYVPVLVFEADDSLERGDRLVRLMKEVNES
ncbi:MAG: 30S ribosome-binding factor RbfA [Chloroflexi bacterium]|nr:30S ribosome-binding factor RbfA [Chloroflexota bacterium]